jgi:hypothetical protein
VQKIDTTELGGVSPAIHGPLHLAISSPLKSAFSTLRHGVDHELAVVTRMGLTTMSEATLTLLTPSASGTQALDPWSVQVG